MNSDCMEKLRLKTTTSLISIPAAALAADVMLIVASTHRTGDLERLLTTQAAQLSSATPTVKQGSLIPG